jgi:hypothetical protein
LKLPSFIVTIHFLLEKESDKEKIGNLSKIGDNKNA